MNLKSVLILLLGTAMSGWATTSLVIVPTPVTLSVGETVNLDVILSTDAQVAGFQFDLLFPTFLQVLSDPTEQGFFASDGCCFSSGSIDNVNGSISGIVDAAGSGADTGADILVSILFTAAVPGAGQIEFQNVALSDPNGLPITVDFVSPASVTATTPEPSTWAMVGLAAAILLGWTRRRVVRW
jgi:hypothetical protein